MNGALAPTITFLRTGTFTDASGNVVTFSQGDLESVVASYDATSYPAPIVIGHPKLNDPAYGWVKGLRMADDRVQASVEQIEPAFAEAVRAGRYKNVSAQLYRPASPGNPKPGQWYLRHIGFLGAAAPAIKGLGQVSFGEDDGSTVKLRAIVSEGVKTRFNLPCGRLMTCDSEELVARARDLQDSHRSLSFADAVVVAMLDVALDDPVVSFGERDPNSDAAKRALVYRMKRAKMLDPALSFSEAKAVAEAQGPSAAMSFATPYGWRTSGEGADLYQRARALQAAEPGLGIVAASMRIQRGH